MWRVEGGGCKTLHPGRTGSGSEHQVSMTEKVHTNRGWRRPCLAGHGTGVGGGILSAHGHTRVLVLGAAAHNSIQEWHSRSPPYLDIFQYLRTLLLVQLGRDDHGHVQVSAGGDIEPEAPPVQPEAPGQPEEKQCEKHRAVLLSPPKDSGFTQIKPLLPLIYFSVYLLFSSFFAPSFPLTGLN